jgi:acetoin utilization protein AcuB
MKVKDLMNPNPITIAKNSTISKALELMKANSIRHLPVVSRGKLLKGFLTMGGLKLGLMPSMVADVTFSDLIIKEPVTVRPDDDIEIAARLIYKNKIGGMPVVQAGRVVGVITESDILRAFIDMMGLLTESSRLNVVIGDKPGLLRKAFHIIQENNGEILSVGMSAPQSTKKIHYFRLSPCKTSRIKKALEKEGFEVLAAKD